MLTLLPTPIGNLDDTSHRVLKCIEEANLVLCEDTRVSKRLLHLLGEKYALDYSEADFISFNSHNAETRLSVMGERLSRERCIYMSDAGMPAISDPGSELVRYCQEHSIEYDVLPGPSALTVAYAASGFENGRFLFYGFLPHKSMKRLEELEKILAREYDTILYEAPHRVKKLLEELGLLAPDREIFAIKEISKIHQRHYRGKAAEILSRVEERANSIRGEWVLVIEGGSGGENRLGMQDILEMDMPPKVKAKLLSKISGESTTVWYERLRESTRR